MNPELQNKIFNQFPTLYMRNNLPWGIECGDGWYDLVKEFSQKVSDLILQYDLEGIYPIQIKEKWGVLRVYMNVYNDKIAELVDEYQDKSFKICEQCGKEGSLRNGSWVRVFCEDHARS